MQLARAAAAGLGLKRGPLFLPVATHAGFRDVSVRGLLVKELHTRRSPSPAKTASPAPLAQPDEAAGQQQQIDEARMTPVEEDTSRQLLLAKAWNFLAGASGAFIFPYISMFLASRGMSSAQIGMLAALRPWLAAPASMATSALADKHKLHAKLLLATCVVSCMLRSSLPLTDSTAALFVMLLVAEVAGAPVGVLGDSTVLSNCKDAGDYGKQRQWASIGWGLASLPAGYLISQAGLTSGFLVYSLASLPLMYVGSQLKYNYQGSSAAATSAPASSAKQQEQQHSLAAELAPAAAADAQPSAAVVSATADAGPSVKELLLQPAVMAFLWKCLLMGFGLGVMSTYEFLFLKHLGAPETLMGMALLMNVCTEVPAFALQGSIMKRMSAPNLLNMVLAVTALRLACYAGLPAVGNVWAVLPVELLHGITFGVGFSTATVYSGKLAPPQLASTFQGMWQATYAGLGAGLGGLVGGLLMERYGGQGLFASAAAIVAAGALGGLVLEHASALLRRGKLQHADNKRKAE